MHILLTGGGTGGHVMPLLAVAHELKKRYPDCELSYIGERSGKFARHIEESGLFTHTSYIYAGKFRRYHTLTIWQRLLDIKTNALNVRDAFLTVLGCLQAWQFLGKYRPEVMFAKGGYVCVPVGIAARLRRTPFLTHDSDTVPGLANRIIGRWAALHATGLPVEFYEYPKQRTVFVGVPVAAAFQRATPARVEEARDGLHIPKDSKVLVITGGSQGSQRINTAVSQIVPDLLELHKDLVIIHHVGQGNERLYGSFSDERLRTAAFFDNFAAVATAADVIVTRAGANSMAEFGLLEKATVVIPSPFLANGHQTENARKLAADGAIVEVDEATVLSDPNVLKTAINDLLSDSKKREKLAAALHAVTKPQAAAHLAELIVSLVQGEGHETQSQ